MSHQQKPIRRPLSPNFSSGPCSKRPGWTLDNLKDACVGRSHRSVVGKNKIKCAMDLSKEVLNLPHDYLLGFVPGSDTGAVESALWSVLGERNVDLIAWENFGETWVKDVVSELKLPGTNIHRAGYGHIPNLSNVDFSNDVVFTWNGTTSGVCVPSGDWIPKNREGLTICDATSAVFAMEIPWEKIDIATYSWQKSLGGEAAHGVIILSPRAVKRIESYLPPWPVPKIFNLRKNNKINNEIFLGATINTPSMLCVEDLLDSLKWAKNIGGISGLVKLTKNNFDSISSWVSNANWVDFLAVSPDIRSPTSVCLKLIEPWFVNLNIKEKILFISKFVELLENEGIANDIKGHREAPPGLRIWCGPTVQLDDLECLWPWLDWAYKETLTLVKEKL
tara:strand:+ start:689 stop:1864 length:1176 start_codon:yes stop_codon:yes gene_type:complete